jgi:GNAT superfamily N-acetyltransferase
MNKLSKIIMNSGGITIRTALKTELSTLLEFEKGIIKAERPIDDTLGTGDIHYYDLAALIDKESCEVVVAVDSENNNKLVGSGFCDIRNAPSYLRHEKFAYLGFMYTHDDYRKRGVNKMVLNHLMLWSKERGIKEVRLEVYCENHGAITAYSKSGFKPNLMEMRLDIDEIGI